MSTDYEAVCDECRLRIHAGQTSAGVDSFGYSSKNPQGISLVAHFVFEHAFCGNGCRIIVADVAEKRPSDDYARPSWDL